MAAKKKCMNCARLRKNLKDSDADAEHFQALAVKRLELYTAARKELQESQEARTYETKRAIDLAERLRMAEDALADLRVTPAINSILSRAYEQQQPTPQAPPLTTLGSPGRYYKVSS